MGLGKRSQELNALDHIKALKHYEALNKMERIEKYKNNLEVTGWHPHDPNEAERHEELEIIRRVIGLLERVVPQRMPRVHKEKA
jgi:hypothetical protein